MPCATPKDYPADWWKLSAEIRFGRAEGRCECDGLCGDVHPDGRCDQREGAPATWPDATPGVVVMLTTAHLDHRPAHCEPDNLRALCQRCHLRHDTEHHRDVRLANQREDLALGGQRSLFGVGRLTGRRS
ncbi:MAG: hypothetical protein H6739_07725 [Alphaproteobacteria bacterium]|nr:hypothetical protein [Alphaproteobacteria bacterium]